jgi:hypothetical protein
VSSASGVASSARSSALSVASSASSAAAATSTGNAASHDVVVSGTGAIAGALIALMGML